MVECYFCGKRYLNNTLLGYHLAKSHHSDFFNGRGLLRFNDRYLLQSLLAGKLTREEKHRFLFCWCDQQSQLKYFGKHLANHGGLEAHLLECLWKP